MTTAEPESYPGHVNTALSAQAMPRYEQRHRNDPNRSCYVEVEGPSAEVMLAYARKVGAQFMEEPPENVFVDYSTTAQVVRWHPFRQHLGISPLPVRWKMTCTIRLAPEVVAERREERAEVHEEVDERPDVQDAESDD